MKAAVVQLSDEQLNWRPGEEDNSIANLIVHIVGNARQNIASGIFGQTDNRDREAEFDTNIYAAKPQLLAMIDETFALLNDALEKQTADEWARTIPVRGNDTPIFHVLNQCASHYSEHLGQILYLAKLQLKDGYATTTIPRATPKPSH